MKSKRCTQCEVPVGPGTDRIIIDGECSDCHKLCCWCHVKLAPSDADNDQARRALKDFREDDERFLLLSGDVYACQKCLREHFKKKQESAKEQEREDRIVARVRGETLLIAFWVIVAVVIVMALRGC